ncbi:MAG: glycosyl hydrolase family 38, partial [Bacteroidales bacterium]|nr:glycosyl hydrolase family 38 [Bacteroidales bacterium]
MKKRLLPVFLLFLFCRTTGAQEFINDDDFLINGYSQKISGLDYTYHSFIPGLRESILIRASGGKDFLEWTTDPAEYRPEKKYAAFIWIAAIGSSPGLAGIDISTDAGQHFTFYTDGVAAWSENSYDGSSLSFTSMMVDQYGDHHGYMVLRIPMPEIKAGIPLKIKACGRKAGLTSWYMTYKKAIKTGVTLNTFPAIIKTGTRGFQLVEAAVFYFGKDSEAMIFAGNRLLARTNLRFGYNTVNAGLPPVDKPEKLKLRVVAGNYTTTATVEMVPVKKWKVDLIQHSHTDIGYTRSQSEILAEHLRYIDYALDYCDATDNYPENARFRWTCEASWPVDEYLKTRPAEQVTRLLTRIREGRIEVTGMYFNFDELPDEQILASSLEAAGRIREKGISVRVAMQNDVNGIAWCMNDYFNQMGIRYLNMGTHGHRALICFDKPTMFWWESPSGNRILTFRAEHYMTGNTVFEIQTGDIDRFRNNMLNYLKDLDARNYPFDEIAIQHSGYLTDNSPPSTIACELVRKWNELYEWPKLSITTTESFFSGMEEKHGAEFPVIRGAWPDWWTDGFGASARETAATRKAAASFIANTGALSMAALQGIPVPEATLEKIGPVNDALLFYTEHTTGYSESVREPFSLQTMEQRAMKESYAWEATRRTASLGEDVLGLLQSKFRREKDPSLIVFNTLNWPRSGPVTVYIDHQIVPRGKVPEVIDYEGNRYPAQALSGRSDGTYWIIWVRNIPAFGYRKFVVKTTPEPKPDNRIETETILENDWYKITVDPSRGVVRSLYDKELSLEIIDQDSRYGMAEFILEKLGNRSQLESRKLDDFVRLSLDTVWFHSITDGPVFSTIRLCGESETALDPGGFIVDIRLFNTEKRVEVQCSLVKKSIVEPEGIYIAFPFALRESKHFTEVQGGVSETGKDQIIGSSNDWYTIQSFTALRNKETQLVFGCTEMPLMQFGAINTGRFTKGAMPQGAHIFSWPMNNYWVTNFNADQRGGHTWTYYLTTSADVSNGFATRFGWSSRIPFLSRILPGDGPGDDNKAGSLISGWSENLLLVNA